MKITEIMKQAGDLQKRIKKQQEELSSKEFEATTGGGMVTVVVNGLGEVLAVTIDPELANKNDLDMLQDLVVGAVNEAMKRVQEAQKDQMAGVMGGLGLKVPGL